MGGFWRVSDHPDLKQVWFSPIADPANVQEGDAVWLEQKPTGTALPDGSIAKDYSGSVPPVQPLAFLRDMVPGTIYGYDGEQTTFSVEVTGGKLPIDYQWRKRNGTNYVNVGTDFPIYSFINNASQGGAYSVIATDADGTKITSKETIMTWTAELVFTTEPPDQGLSTGNTLTLVSAAAGGVGARKYQWYKDGVSLGSANGATTNTYSKANITAADAGKYTVKVTDTNPNGAKTITSRESVVTVS